MSSCSVGELRHRGGERRPVERGDLAGVLGGERVGAALGFVEQRLDAGGAVPPAAAPAIEQRFQIPCDPLDLGIGDLFCGHGRRDYDARSPSSISVR